MQKVLFLSLGNRDLQLPQNANIQVSIFSDHFVKGNDDTGGNYVLIKNNFNAHSQSIYDLYDTMAEHVTFPMVEQTLSEVGEDLEQVILLTTKQEPLDAQDCHFVALFLEKWLTRKGFKVTYRPIQFPPVDLEQLMDFYNQLYDEFADFQIYFGNSGGTPDMRAATHMAGMFRGINFITIQAREKKNSIKNFAKQEQLVLRHIIEKMLSSYDYGGILNLPIDNQPAKLLAQYALARLQLDHQTVRDLHQKLNYPELYLKDELNIPDLEQEMVQSARIKLHQKAYADYLWRLFTISDNLLTPHLELLLEGQIIHDKKSGHELWNTLLGNHQDLIPYLKLRTINNFPLLYTEPNAFAYLAILDFFKEKGIWNEPILLSQIRKNLDAIRGLRNQIAHYYKGINRREIESKLIAKQLPNGLASLDGLNQLLCQYVNVDSHHRGIYDWINTKILELLKS